MHLRVNTVHPRTKTAHFLQSIGRDQGFGNKFFQLFYTPILAANAAARLGSVPPITDVIAGRAPGAASILICGQPMSTDKASSSARQGKMKAGQAPGPLFFCVRR